MNATEGSAVIYAWKDHMSNSPSKMAMPGLQLRRDADAARQTIRTSTPNTLSICSMMLWALR